MHTTKSSHVEIPALFFAVLAAFLSCCSGNLEPIEGRCNGIDCSGHGECTMQGGKAVCICDEGYKSDGLSCVSSCSDYTDCDDGNPCTDDGCDDVLNCVHSPNRAPCDDSDPCTHTSLCDQGTCQPGQPLTCDDYNQCTEDWCETDVGCQHRDLDIDCDDHDVCTTGERCIDGQCMPERVLECDDGNRCTLDQCDPMIGCRSIPAPGEGRGSGECDDGVDNDCDGITDGADPGCAIRPAVCSLGGWCWENPLPTGNDLTAVWGVAADSVWAVGEAGTIMHFDGQQWTGGQSVTTDVLSDVWGPGNGDFWAAGDGGVFLKTARSDVWTHPYPLVDRPMIAIGGGSPADVWAVGYSGRMLRIRDRAYTWWESITHRSLSTLWAADERHIWASGWNAGLLFWDGASWSVDDRVDCDSIPGIWGFGPEDVWTACDHDLIHTWIFRLTDPAAGWNNMYDGEHIHPRDIWGTEPEDIWVVGILGAMIHWDGSGWTSVASGTGDFLSGLWGSGPDDVWAVGDHGVLLRWDGDSWSKVTSEVWEFDWNANWANSADDVWVGGEQGIIYRRNASGWGRSHHNLMEEVSGLWGSGPDDVWAAGRDSSEPGLMHFDGQAWSSAQGVGRVELYGVWGLAAEDVWAVGRGATLHFDGQAWTEVDPGASWQLHDVWCAATDDCWAVGNDVVLRWDGQTWSNVTPDLMKDFWLRGVWGSEESDVWIAGGIMTDYPGTSDSSALILHWNGVEWDQVDFDPFNSLCLYDVWGQDADDIRAVGFDFGAQKGIVLRYDGTAWSEEPVGCGEILFAISGTADGQLWAAGKRGAILRSPP